MTMNKLPNIKTTCVSMTKLTVSEKEPWKLYNTYEYSIAFENKCVPKIREEDTAVKLN